MKARIKGLGQIIDVVQVETRLETDGIHSYYAEKGTEDISGRSLWKDTQLDFDIGNQSDFDWSSFRREAAKDILAGMVAHQRITYGSNYGILAKYAISYADELIRQLKQE